jgi:hypothetical protein
MVVDSGGGGGGGGGGYGLSGHSITTPGSLLRSASAFVLFGNASVTPYFWLHPLRLSHNYIDGCSLGNYASLFMFDL